MPNRDQPPLDALQTVHKRIDELSADLATNTRATEDNTASIARVEGSVADVKRNTDSIVDFFTAASGAFKVLGWLGKVAKWFTAVAAACAVAYAIWHGNTPK